MRGLFVAGCAVGVTCVGLAVRLACSLLGEGARSKVLGLAAVLLSAWLFYQAAGLLYNFGAIWLAGALGIKQELVNLWFAPFAADWAMAMLRIPLMTIAALAAMAVALVKIKHTQIRFAVSGCMLVVALVLLPYGVARASVPFLEPDPPSAKQARPIVEPMLSEIYHALNLEDENSTYDKLAEQVSSDLVTDLYLDSRRRLVSGTRKGATIEVKQVQLEDIGLSEASGKNGHSYLCRWTVRAKVSHWQHIHERRNVYEGDLELVVEDSNWKLGGLNLRSEEREVVPGSFRSR
jgi:hypothetical protein